jgi:hypothetical protein
LNPEQDLWLIHRTRSNIMSGELTRIKFAVRRKSPDFHCSRDD